MPPSRRRATSGRPTNRCLRRRAPSRAAGAPSSATDPTLSRRRQRVGLCRAAARPGGQPLRRRAGGGGLFTFPRSSGAVTVAPDALGEEVLSCIFPASARECPAPSCGNAGRQRDFTRVAARSSRASRTRHSTPDILAVGSSKVSGSAGRVVSSATSDVDVAAA